MIAQVPITVSLPISTVVVPQDGTQVIVPIGIISTSETALVAVSGLQQKYAGIGHKPLRIAGVYRQYCDPSRYLYADRDGGLGRANRIDDSLW